jgi:hypothetical protein
MTEGDRREYAQAVGVAAAHNATEPWRVLTAVTSDATRFGLCSGTMNVPEAVLHLLSVRSSLSGLWARELLSILALLSSPWGRRWTYRETPAQATYILTSTTAAMILEIQMAMQDNQTTSLCLPSRLSQASKGLHVRMLIIMAMEMQSQLF